MKNLNIEFQDKEFKRIIKVKEISQLSWKHFILKLVDESVKQNFGRFLK